MFIIVKKQSIFSAGLGDAREKGGGKLESIYFLILNDVGGGLQNGLEFDDGPQTKLCILLDPSAAGGGGGQTKTFHQMQDMFCKTHPTTNAIDSYAADGERQKIDILMRL